ncbi:MAG: ABC transporter ATP-binding protein [Firmicutes bacterium]|nr:ABC transporter ATP-binding protein [Bacillota bacterium]
MGASPGPDSTVVWGELSVIEVNGLKKVYKVGSIEVAALRGVSLRIDEGQFVAIMGPSGSGKTTFMNILGCLDQPTEGSYSLGGVLVSEMDDTELARVRNRRIGFVFQTYNLLPRLSAVANVELPLIYRGVPRRTRRLLAVRALEAVGLKDRLHHRPSELSGGQQQRVAIARSLVTHPRIVLADEPTGNLDTKSGVEIMAIFQALNDSGITVVLVTHNADIAQYAKRIVRFRDGLIVSDEAVSSRTIAERDESLDALIAGLTEGAAEEVKAG